MAAHKRRKRMGREYGEKWIGNPRAGLGRIKDGRAILGAIPRPGRGLDRNHGALRARGRIVTNVGSGRISDMTHSDREAKARARAEAQYGFFKHLAVFLVINLMLFLINLGTGPDELWFVWSLIGWGVAVAFHGLRVFLLDDPDLIIDRLTKRELRKDEADRD
jgi:hypothetical protein